MVTRGSSARAKTESEAILEQTGESSACQIKKEHEAHAESELTREDQQDMLAQQRSMIHQLIEQQAATQTAMHKMQTAMREQQAAAHEQQPASNAYSVTFQWQGKEMKVVTKVLVPILTATLLSVRSPISLRYAQVLKCVRSFVYFVLMCEYRSHSENTLGYMHRYLSDFYSTKDVFRTFRTSKITKAGATKLKEKLLQVWEIQREGREDWESLSLADKRRLQTEDEESIADEVLDYTMDNSDFNFKRDDLRDWG